MFKSPIANGINTLKKLITSHYTGLRQFVIINTGLQESCDPNMILKFKGTILFNWAPWISFNNASFVFFFF